MKVLNLQCGQQHRFEGWFASEDDFSGQLALGLVLCPLCGDACIQKMLTAPRLNLRSHREDRGSSTAAGQRPDVESRGPLDAVAVQTEVGDADPMAPLQAQLLKAVRAVLDRADDVGDRFADQARAMHHGDMAPRSIRGRTTPEVAKELVDEGIAVMPIPDLPALKETLQ